MMKNSTYSKLFFVALMAMMAMTSCDDDASLAYDVDGVWQGTISGNYYYNRYRSNDYDTELSFTRRGTYGGTGYEIDYNYGTIRYYRNYFDWTVQNGKLYLDYDDGSRIIIRDYEIYSMNSNLRFRGYFDDSRTGEELAHFQLVKVVDYNNSYDYKYGYYSRMRGIKPDGAVEEGDSLHTVSE